MADIERELDAVCGSLSGAPGAGCAERGTVEEWAARRPRGDSLPKPIADRPKTKVYRTKTNGV
jgi:hypothetical protein